MKSNEVGEEEKEALKAKASEARPIRYDGYWNFKRRKNYVQQVNTPVSVNCPFKFTSPPQKLPGKSNPSLSAIDRHHGSS
jgi:hypothetical protein